MSETHNSLFAHNYRTAAQPVRMDEPQNNTLRVELGGGTSPIRSMNLEELSQELERRTRETQQLEEDVERATKLTMEKIQGRTLGDGVTVRVPLSWEGIQPLRYGHNLEVRDNAEKDVLERTLEQYSMQVSELQKQLREMHELHEQQKFLLRQSIIKLQTRLQECQIERDVLSDWRAKEARKQADLVLKLQRAVAELQVSQQDGDQRFLQAKGWAESLDRKRETLEQMLQEVHSTLRAYKEGSDRTSHMGSGTPSPRRPISERALQMENQLADMRGQEKDLMMEGQKERIEQLITSHDQEVAMLREKLSSSQSEASRLQVQVELLQRQAERQASVYPCQINDLESSLSILRSQLTEAQQTHANQVETLEQQLTQVRQDRDRSLQQARDLDSRLRQLTVASEEHQVEVARLQREIQLGQARLEEARGRALALKAEGEALRIDLEDREKRVEQLGTQVESVTQLSVQQGLSFDSLLGERSRLVNELNQQKVEIQQLKAALDQQERWRGALTLAQAQHQVVLSEKARSLKKLTLEKQRLGAELEEQRRQLISLTEQHTALKTTHSSSCEELQAANTKLKTRLQAAHTDLHRAKSALRALEGADGHGLKVAVGMQKQITAKRQQIDALQGQIQLLEETVDKLMEEKRYQAVKERRQSQEFAALSAERTQLLAEVEALHSLEKRWNEKAGRLESALDKMSERFTECQDYIQQQEQEVMRLKLLHTLDMRELQGQNLRATSNLRPICPDSPSQHTSVPRREPKAQVLLENPTQELRSLVQELRGVIEEDGSHLSSAPERSQSPVLHEVTKDNSTGTKGSNNFREPPTLHTMADLDEKNFNCTFPCEGTDHSVPDPPPRYSSFCESTWGRASPVYSLLTSLAETPIIEQQQAELSGETCKKLQGKLDSLQTLVEDLQTKNQEMSSMIKGHEKRKKKVKDRGKPLNGLR